MQIVGINIFKRRIIKSIILENNLWHNQNRMNYTKHCNRKAIRTAFAGKLLIKREVIWPKQVIAELKKLGYKTAALALTDDSVSIDDSELMKEEKLAVILGNEGEGLENETIALCDYTVKIPMTHGVDSLNVAAASAVAFWQLGKIIL